jgi:hypothetical protein
VKAHRWLALLPAIGMLGGVPFANRVEPYVFGLPFLLFWIVAWVLITSGVMGLIYALDRSAGRTLDHEAEVAHSMDTASGGDRG